MPGGSEVLSSRAAGPRLGSVLFLGAATALGAVLCGVALFAGDRLGAGVPVALVFYPLLWAIAIGLHRRVWRAARRVAVTGDHLEAELSGWRMSVPFGWIAAVETTGSTPELVRVVVAHPETGATELTFFGRSGAQSGASDLRSRIAAHRRVD